mgnify:CR=1 FL=1
MTTTATGAGRTTTITPALLTTLALLSAVAPFAIDLYLPAFPTMVDDLHTTPTGVQLTLTAFLFGLATGQLVFGPLSDRFGRVKPLLAGAALPPVAKRDIAKGHQAVVVEGYTDVMAMHLAGVTTAVASCGTAFGDEHLSMLRRLMMDDNFFRGELIYVFDGDAAGRAAALKAFDGEQNLAGQSFVAVAADGMDPCDLRLQQGDTALRDLVARRHRCPRALRLHIGPSGDRKL